MALRSNSFASLIHSMYYTFAYFLHSFTLNWIFYAMQSIYSNWHLAVRWYGNPQNCICRTTPPEKRAHESPIFWPLVWAMLHFRNNIKRLKWIFIYLLVALIIVLFLCRLLDLASSQIFKLHWTFLFNGTAYRSGANLFCGRFISRLTVMWRWTI